MLLCFTAALADERPPKGLLKVLVERRPQPGYRRSEGGCSSSNEVGLGPQNVLTEGGGAAYERR